MLFPHILKKYVGEQNLKMYAVGQFKGLLAIKIIWHVCKSNHQIRHIAIFILEMEILSHHRVVVCTDIFKLYNANANYRQLIFALKQQICKSCIYIYIPSSLEWKTLIIPNPDSPILTSLHFSSVFFKHFQQWSSIM